ncbi:MAG: hypothetical protein Q9172_005745 [Xanthocarpia lactea]
MCAQRLRSVQYRISNSFEYDDECSSTAVQPYLTAFCGQWGVDIAAAEKAKPSTTTTLGGSRPTGQATPGSTRNAGQPAPTSTSTDGPPSSGGLTDNKITIIATVVGSVAGVIAVVIAWKMLLYVRKQRANSHNQHWDQSSQAPAGQAQAYPEIQELQGSHIPARNLMNGTNYNISMQHQGRR